jgi:hypothetical protein
MDVFGEDRSNGVNGFVAGQASRHETSHCVNDGLEVLGDLVLNDCMENSVRLQIGQLDACNAVMFFREVDSSLFVERKPLLWVRRVVWVVPIQRAILLKASEGIGKLLLPIFERCKSLILTG